MFIICFIGLPSKLPEQMPGVLQKYYELNDTNVFLYAKPFRKTKGKTDNEFKDLWIRNVYYVTEDSFPTIHRRSQILSTKVTETSPIEFALQSIHSKVGVYFCVFVWWFWLIWFDRSDFSFIVQHFC